MNGKDSFAGFLLTIFKKQFSQAHTLVIFFVHHGSSWYWYNRNNGEMSAITVMKKVISTGRQFGSGSYNLAHGKMTVTTKDELHIVQ